MPLQAFFVDAFTDRIFHGNPAAIVPLTSWLPDALMQSIAAEHNIAETAYYVPSDAGFDIRWFTPTLEIDLCGHATVAAAFVVELLTGRREVVFGSKSGPLPVTRDTVGRYVLDFPSRPPAAVEADANLLAGLNIKPKTVLAARDYLVRYDSEQEVRDLKPDMNALAASPRFVIATAPGDLSGVDFVSRFFAPRAGVPEDPVTGSAHSTLIPYWAGEFGKQHLTARQISPRGGDLWCELRDQDRVGIAGNAVLYAKSEIYIPG
jgi:PhzF family phenazine biosynthesis protein